MRLRSFSDVSDKSDRSSNCDSPKVGPIPAPQMQQIRQPQAPSAELVYTRLCAMAVALKFSHLGVNSNLIISYSPHWNFLVFEHYNSGMEMIAIKDKKFCNFLWELLKLSKVCIKNNIWKWYEVYDGNISSLIQLKNYRTCRTYRVKFAWKMNFEENFFQTEIFPWCLFFFESS